MFKYDESKTGKTYLEHQCADVLDNNNNILNPIADDKVNIALAPEATPLFVSQKIPSETSHFNTVGVFRMDYTHSCRT